jgi:hypothetical protein
MLSPRPVTWSKIRGFTFDLLERLEARVGPELVSSSPKASLYVVVHGSGRTCFVSRLCTRNHPAHDTKIRTTYASILNLFKFFRVASSTLT